MKTMGPKIYKPTKIMIALLCGLLSATNSIASEISSSAKNECSAEVSPLSNGEKPKLIRTGFKFLEGPTWSKIDQAFYFSEMDFNSAQTYGPESTIYKLTLPHKIELVQKNVGTNGLLADGDFLYTMDHANRSLSKLTLNTLKSEVLSQAINGMKYNSPNDLVKADNGIIYFTDPNWQLGKRKQETPFTGFYAYLPSGKTILLDKTLTKPNGIAISPDQQTLYVGDASNRIFAYPLKSDGTLSERTLFAEIDSPDGMAVDCAGNLYATSHSKGMINIYASNGKLRDSFTLGHSVTNIAFGGEQGKTLLITSPHGLYYISSNIKGLYFR